MTVGEIVDFCIEYNNMHSRETGKKREEKERSRKATQADWDAFWG